MESIKISTSALNVEWQRLSVIAENLANINSTKNELGEIFKPRKLLSGPDISFEGLLNQPEMGLKPAGVKIMGFEEVSSGVRTVFDPDHPHADPDGFVSFPKIDHADEMTMMIKTSRAYEANLTAISIAQQMYMQALQIGR